MRNLAGNKDADLFVHEELLLAGIPIVHREPSNREVPAEKIGKLGSWTFTRAWSYWVARARDGTGLPLDVAEALHFRLYPIGGDGRPEIYGQVVRVDGHCGAPEPAYGARHFDKAGLELILDPVGEQASRAEPLRANPSMRSYFARIRYVPNLDGAARSVVTSYHIDDLLGLRELARVIREE